MAQLQRLAGMPTWLLSRAHARAHALLSEAFAAEGVRGYHFRLLAALEEHGAVSQAELGRLAGIDRSDVVAVLNDLVGLGMAEREADAVDRRRNVVVITTHGRAALRRLDGVLDGVQEAVLAPLTPREQTTLTRLLAKIA